jgi:hypothetical protein
MPVTKVTASQFTAALAKSIAARNKAYDTAIGPIPDLVTIPLGKVLESQNADIYKLDSLLKFTNNSTWTHDDLVAFVANEGILPDAGGSASVMLTFSAAQITRDVQVQAGYPIATQVDETTGDSYTFTITTGGAIQATNKSAFFNPDTQRYELVLEATCTLSGKVGNVAANRINRPLRPLVGFDSVTNVDKADGGRDETTDAELVEQYLIAITGTDESTPDGSRRVTRDLFSNVYDSLTVYGSDSLLTRAGTDAGAVDLWVVGTQAVTRTDLATFMGVSQPIPLIRQPVMTVVKVAQGATVYVENVDYIVVKDTSGLAYSTRGQDAIMFIPGGACPATSGAITITYIQNYLIEQIQAIYETPEHFSFGRDLLVRAAIQKDIQVAATLTVRSGFNPDDLITTISNNIYTLINSMLLNGRIPGISDGGSIQISDVNNEARKVSGVDNFVITTFDFVGGTGVVDISMQKNWFPRILLSDINIISG